MHAWNGWSFRLKLTPWLIPYVNHMQKTEIKSVDENDTYVCQPSFWVDAKVTRLLPYVYRFCQQSTKYIYSTMCCYVNWRRILKLKQNFKSAEWENIAWHQLLLYYNVFCPTTFDFRWSNSYFLLDGMNIVGFDMLW